MACSSTHHNTLLLLAVSLSLLVETQLLHCSHALSTNSSTLQLQVPARCHRNQAAALLRLKRSFSFTTTLSSWRDGTDCCRWEGIGCDNVTGRVTALDLPDWNLQSSRLHPALFRLTSLQHLNLASNNFSGSQLPMSGFERLTQLSYLNLSDCAFAGQVRANISRLTNLVTLDIGGNSDLELHVPSLVANLSNLKELHLDQVTIAGTTTECFKALANHVPLLRILSLPECGLFGPIHPSLSSLHSLSVIDLGWNSLTGPLPDLFSPSNFPLLRVLVLADNTFDSGTFPPGISGLKNLRILDLSETSLTGGIPNSIGNLTSLTELYLSGNSFSGGLPWALSNLTHLTVLDCEYSGLSGRIPWLTNLTRLENIRLSDNNLTGPVPLDGHLYPYLTLVDLRNNSLSGTVPTSLFTQPALQVLNLEMNQLSGAIEVLQNPSATLTVVYLNNNQLTGAVPTSMSHLAALVTLRLDNNNFTGPLDLNPFMRLRNLSRLSASHNPLLSASGNGNEAGASGISILELAYCNLTRLPSALRYLPRLDALDLSGNQIRGEIPDWIWRNMTSLDLSHNLFTTVEQPLAYININFIDLSFNMLRGPVPFHFNGNIIDYSNNKFSSLPPSSFLRQLKVTNSVNLANNELSGRIPYAECSNHDSLYTLDLSGNNLSGLVPPYLLKGCNDLMVLNLRGNHLGGTWPDEMDESCQLRLIDLHGNQIQGRLPRSLARCQNLMALDVGGNHFVDSFPLWLGKLPQLRLLVLRSNKFRGPVSIPLGENSSTTGYFSRLQIIDLAGNGFTGDLASDIFRSFKSMVWYPDETAKDEITVFSVIERFSYQVAVDVAMKQQYMRLTKIQPGMAVIDLSSNQFRGFIPRTVGNMTSLHVLNFSRNAFAGEIPRELGQLVRIESLDLSWNDLTGVIPQELVTLTTLEWLNLSYNHLSGSIPSGPQFSTFNSSSFQGGNRGLYGCPLPVRFNLTIMTPPPSSSPPEGSPADHRFQLVMLCLFVGAGFGVGFALSIVLQVICSCRRKKMALQR